MWFFLALLSAATVAIRRIYDKKLLARLEPFTAGWLVQALALPSTLLALLASGRILNPFGLDAHFWVPLLVASLVYYPVNTYLYSYAIKSSELSKVLPIQSLGPLVAMLLSWVTIGERPSSIGVAGIALIMAGVYALHLKGRRLHNPLRPFLEERASLYMLLSVCIIGVLSLLDKIAIRASDPLLYSFVETLAGSGILYGVARYIAREPRLQPARLRRMRLGTIGTLQGITATAFIAALAAGPIAYVGAVRSTNVLMGSLIGICYYKEPFTHAKKVALVLIIAGTLVLALQR